MSISCAWFDDSQTIIHWTFDTRWSWYDALAAQQKSNKMIDTASGKVHCLLDMQNCFAIPIGSLKHIPQLFQNRHPRCGLVLIVLEPQSSLIKLWHTLTIMLPITKQTPILFFSSIEDAIIHLDSLNSSAES